jgi:hypothetical protein
VHGASLAQARPFIRSLKCLALIPNAFLTPFLSIL